MKILKWVAGLLLGTVVLIAIAAGWIWTRLHPDPPEVQVWMNGNIITMDERGTRATALVIERDRIVALGRKQDVAPWLSDGAERIDLGGRTVVPGFIEAHGHFPGAGLSAVGADLNPPPIGSVSTIEDAVDALKSVDAERPGKGWLLGFGYDDTMFAEKRHLDRHDLDRVSRSRPVLAIHISGHMVAVSSLVLERFGIDRNTPDPPGGMIARDSETGEPTGLLFETAGRPIMIEALKLPPLEQLEVARSAVDEYVREGFTTVQNGLANEEQIAGLSFASKLGLIPLRIVVWPAEEVGLHAIETGDDLSAYASEKMHVGAIKLVGDGSIQGYTGFLREPYHVLGEHDEGYRGYPNMDAEQMRDRVERLHCAGHQVAVHGNGDAAIDQFLNAWKSAIEKCPRDDARPILVHAQMATHDQLQRMRELGVSPTFFSAHVYYWGDRHRDVFLGPERAARISPAASADKLGLRFSTHLDTPVVPIDSALQLWAPVARETSGGQALGPEERISVEQALRSMTSAAAWQLHLEDRIGSIEPGKKADLVVLSADPFDDATDLRLLEVLRTVVGGVTVYDATL